MNKEWLSFFESEAGNGASVEIDDAGNIGFGGGINPGLAKIAVNDTDDINATPKLAELSQLAVVDVSGEDAAEFLQAQVCNDLTTLPDDQVQMNGYCSPKGRLLALFTVLKHTFDSGPGYRLVLPGDVAPAFVKRLQMFVLRAKVEISVRSDLVCTGILVNVDSTNNQVSLPESFPSLPSELMGLTRTDAVQCFRWHNDPGFNADGKTKQHEHARYVCVAQVDKLKSLWSSKDFARVTWAQWRWGDINACIPNVFAATQDQFIPQMLNMQFLDGLSFKKGCYPGQEIVARMQYLGKLKKHMKHFFQEGAVSVPELATTLTTESNNNAGQIVDAVLNEHGLNLLAVVNAETPAGELMLEGTGVQEIPLGYSIVADAKPSSK